MVPGPWALEYELVGQGTVSVTYTTGQGPSQKQQTVALPWTLPLQSADAPRNPMLSAQLQGNGTVTCNMHQWYYDPGSTTGRDRVTATATTSGANGIVRCSGPSS